METALLSERDELKDLLQSPGFARFMAHARHEWATGFGVRLKQAVAHAKQHGEDLNNAVEKVDYANDQINALLSWPRERLSQLEQQAAPRGGMFASRRQA